MISEPQKEHAWLKKLVGTWTYEGECVIGPGQPPMKSSGVETVRMLGDFWMVADSEGEMPGGGAAKMVMTLGYDLGKARYVGSWYGSMSPAMFIYDGSMDAAGRVLTLDSEGPSFKGDGTIAKYQDIIEVIGPDHRTLSSRVRMPDGTWNPFMTAHYRRKS
jgi:hypothetical protein